MGLEACVLTKEIRDLEYSREIQANRSTVMSSAAKADSILEAVGSWLRQGNKRKGMGNRDADLYAKIVEIIEGE